MLRTLIIGRRNELGIIMLSNDTPCRGVCVCTVHRMHRHVLALGLMSRATLKLMEND